MLLFIGFLFCTSLAAQNHNIDSLKKVLNVQKTDTGKLHTLDRICTGFFDTYAWDSIARYADMQFTLAKKINNPKELALAHKSLGYGNYGINNFQAAYENFNTALKIMREINDKDGISVASWLLGKINYQLVQYPEALKNARTALEIVKDRMNRPLLGGCYYDLGLYYEVLHDYPHSLEYYYKALRMFEQLGESYYGSDKYYAKLSNTCSSMGNVYILQDNYEQALKYLQLATQATEKSSRKNSLGYISNCVGEVYFKQGNYSMALQKQFDAIELWKKYADLGYQSWALPHTYRNIGHVYKKLGELALQQAKQDSASEYLSLALENYNASLEGYKQAADKSGIPAANINLGKLYMVFKDEIKARQFLANGLKLSEKAGDTESIRESHLSLYQLDSMQGNYQQALIQYKQYIIYRDSLLNEEGKIKSEGYRLQYEFEKKEDEIKLLYAENKLQALQAKQQKQKKNIEYTGWALLLLAAGYGFYRYQRKRKLHNQKSLMNERLRISRELHDEVGATLSGISMYSHLASEQLKSSNNNAVESSLNIMQESSSQMVDKLNDIVWLINPEKDTLQQLINRLEDYAIKMAAIKDILVTVNVQGEISDTILSAEIRRNIYLLCKEAINNSVKYSEANALSFSLTEINDFLNFTIADNGQGFDNTKASNGNGLSNMRSRAQQMNAILTIESVNGTTVKLKVKITP